MSRPQVGDRGATGRRVRLAGAVGGETTTRHACAAPVRLGSIQARGVRRRVAGTGPFAPDRARQPHPSACRGNADVGSRVEG